MPVDDFDFLEGPWLVDNVLFRSVEARFSGTHSGIVKHMGGVVNTDLSTFTPEPPADPFQGMSLRLLDPRTDEWSIYWIGGTTVVLSDPVHGRFEGEVGTFTSAPDGDDVWQFLWTCTDSDTPHWEQRLSKDAGTTWRVDWTMDFRRP